MNPADQPARKPAFAPADMFGTSAGKGNAAFTEPGSFLILSQEPPWLPCLYEIAAFCPAFNANRTGEIRSEHSSACPFLLQASPGFYWWQNTQRTSFKSKQKIKNRDTQSIKSCSPSSKASPRDCFHQVTDRGYTLCFVLRG